MKLAQHGPRLFLNLQHCNFLRNDELLVLKIAIVCVTSCLYLPFIHIWIVLFCTIGYSVSSTLCITFRIDLMNHAFKFRFLSRLIKSFSIFRSFLKFILLLALCSLTPWRSLILKWTWELSRQIVCKIVLKLKYKILQINSTRD